MQEAIGAQYMQRHLPKLEPFLRRVVSTSPRSYLHAIIELPEIRVQEEVCTVFSCSFAFGNLQVQEEVHNVLIRHIDSAHRLASDC
jgi:hypothetical protein